MICPRCHGTGKEAVAVTMPPLMLPRCLLCRGERYLATNDDETVIYLPAERGTTTMLAPPKWTVYA